MAPVLLLLFNQAFGEPEPEPEPSVSSSVQLHPLPSLTFRVNLVVRPDFYSAPPPGTLDSLITSMKKSTLRISEVPYPLKDGDTFTLHGAKAIRALQVYSDYLTVIDG